MKRALRDQREGPISEPVQGVEGFLEEVPLESSLKTGASRTETTVTTQHSVSLPSPRSGPEFYWGS